ncbi:MAG: ABC transporter substrate-binding protein [Bacteroidota bacterium]
MSIGFRLFLLAFLLLSLSLKKSKLHVLNYCESGKWSNLYPLQAFDFTSVRIVTQVYEGLTAYNPENLNIELRLAEKTEVDVDKTIWTLYLRKGIKFHTDGCFGKEGTREMNAYDVKFCFDKALNPGAFNYYYEVVKDLFKGGDEGVKVINDYCIQFVLNDSNTDFLHILTLPCFYIYPKEAFDKYGEDMQFTCVGTGPFRIAEAQSDLIQLKKNKNYWRKGKAGKKLPYLDIVNIYMDNEAIKTEKAFIEGEIDFCFITAPNTQFLDVNNTLKNEYAGSQLQTAASHAIFYYGFQHFSEPFKSKKVRQAFISAIDREKLIISLLGGRANLLIGAVPSGLPGYDNSKLKSQPFDPEKARQLLAEAGYSNGKDFPKIKLRMYGGGDRNILMAQFMQNALKENLNIDIEIVTSTFSQHLDQVESGKSQFWRSSWIPDHPLPIEYLKLFHSKTVPDSLSKRSYVNTVRYINPDFDKLLTLAAETKDPDSRNNYYIQAEQLLIEDAVILPLFYDKLYLIHSKNVKDLYLNAMKYLDLSVVSKVE